MQNFAVKAALVSLLSIMLASVGANASLCVLKNPGATTPSTYTPGGPLSSKYTLKAIPTTGITGTIGAGLDTATPCTTADTADGTTDGSVTLTWETGADIVVDIVYQQDPANQYKVLLFHSSMYYAGANDSNKMVGTSPTRPFCNDDPGTFFYDPMFDLTKVCEKNLTAASVASVAVGSEGLNITGESWPSDGGSTFYPANFVLDRITFANAFTVGTNVYTIDFEKAGVTDVGVVDAGTGDNCGILSLAQNCGNFIPPIAVAQAIMPTKINITAPSCYIGAPVSGSVSCAANPAGPTFCPAANADSIVTLTYGLPTTCYLTSACTTPATDGACTGITSAVTAVTFNNLAGVAQPAEFDGTFTEASNTNIANPVPSYTLTGAHRTGLCLPCGGTKILTVTAPAKCGCGSPPTVTPSPLTAITDTTYVQNNDISISYIIADTDKTGTIAADIAEVKFYYRNSTDDNAVAQEVIVVPPSSAINSTSGKVTVTIDKLYVAEGVSIFLGIIVKDVDGNSAAYPANFDVVTATKKFTAATASEIPGANIITATAFGFSSMPTMNQYPFIAAEDANNMLQIEFALNALAQVSMRIYTLDGRLVRQIDNSASPLTSGTANECVPGEECNRCHGYATNAGDLTGCQWDGTDYRGGRSVVGSGMYIVNIHAVAIGTLFTGASLDYTKGIVVVK